MKELRRLLLITAATAGLALSLTGCSKNVDFLQYADVTFDGINGQATATVNVDYNQKLHKILLKNMHSPATRLRFPLREHPNIFALWTK